MAAAKEVFYAVDRIEGRLAVLVGDDGRQLEFVRRDLPARAREGSVLRVRVSAGGVPDFRAAVVDEVERKRRLEEARERLDELKQGDAGGDIAL